MKPKLSENMSKKLISVFPNEKIGWAYNLMKGKNIRHLVVIDETDSVCGILSDRDCARAMKTKVEKSTAFKVVDEHFDPNEEVADYMSWDIFSMTEESTLKDVARAMLERKLSCALITDSKMDVKGIITTDDLLWALVQLLDDQDEGLLEKMKADIFTSPLGSLANSLSQAGI